ncbi:hypothetical protein [Streptomyces melanogenes]|uniref:hypothetical protein n=1 Tax=Streptomyces melanogenes TaxID=67326 RepID=UPI00379C7104
MATPTRNQRPAWLPAQGVLDAVRAGMWWDAVTIEGDLGRAVAERLSAASGEMPGPIVCDPLGPTAKTYFLVPRGTAALWDEPDTAALGECCYIGLPGTLDADPHGVHWIVPPTARVPRLVRPELLRTMIAEARKATS